MGYVGFYKMILATKLVLNSMKNVDNWTEVELFSEPFSLYVWEVELLSELFSFCVGMLDSSLKRVTDSIQDAYFSTRVYIPG